jgi:hypothetical protein
MIFIELRLQQLQICAFWKVSYATFCCTANLKLQFIHVHFICLDVVGETRGAEHQIVKAWQMAQASKYLRTQRSRHPHKEIDIIFLDVNDSVWYKQSTMNIKRKGMW